MMLLKNGLAKEAQCSFTYVEPFFVFQPCIFGAKNSALRLHILQNQNSRLFFVKTLLPLIPSIHMDEIWDAFHQLVGFKKHPKVENHINLWNLQTSQSIPRFQTNKPMATLHRLHTVYNVLTLIDSIDLGLLAERWSASASFTEACSVSTKRWAKVANCTDKEQASETELGINHDKPLKQEFSSKQVFLLLLLLLLWWWLQ